MAISIKCNKEEERIILGANGFNAEELEPILYNALVDTIEDLEDIEAIEDYEKDLKAGKISYVNADTVFK